MTLPDQCLRLARLQRRVSGGALDDRAPGSEHALYAVHETERRAQPTSTTEHILNNGTAWTGRGDPNDTDEL